jgi:hypothetical protein
MIGNPATGEPDVVVVGAGIMSAHSHYREARRPLPDQGRTQEARGKSLDPRTGPHHGIPRYECRQRLVHFA